MLKIEDLQVEIGGQEIVKGLNLEVGEGEIHAIMGPNGSGKSTLANVLMGHPRYEVTGGSITFQGEDIFQMDPKFAERYLNEGFSGGEKKRNEILQMLMLDPKLAIMDETDSGLDID